MDLIEKLNYLEHENNSRLDALIIQDRFVSEIQKRMEVLKISKKNLAEKLGVSGSYITQVFRGNKFFNFSNLAGIQSVLDIDFKIAAVNKGELEVSNMLFCNDLFVNSIPIISKGINISKNSITPNYEKLSDPPVERSSTYEEKAA